MLVKLENHFNNSIKEVTHHHRINRVKIQTQRITSKIISSISNHNLIKIIIQSTMLAIMTHSPIKVRIIKIKNNYKTIMDKDHMDFSCIKYQARLVEFKLIAHK